MLEEKLTIRPPFRRRRAASRRVLNVPFRLTAMWRSNSASLLSAMVARFMMPALLISTSTPPKAVSADSNMRATAATSFRQQYPDIRLHFSEAHQPLDMIREGFDCILRAGELSDSPL